MVSVKQFYDMLIANDIDFFAGVPDSLLKNLCAYITDNSPKDRNIIAANEGNALAIATGYHLATSKVPCVYMQNSGQGNIVNPLLSLVDEDVYKIPVLFIIGWRGEPGVHDEPQHVKQGKITDKLLQTLGVEYSVLSADTKDVNQIVQTAIDYIKINNKPFALVIRKGTFDNYILQNKKADCSNLSRETAIENVASTICDDAVIVSTTGQISRELYEYRSRNNLSHNTDFLTVGSMGHASSIAFGIALAQPNRPVFVFDGDGACLMHMGAIPVIASQKLKNFKHIVFNNCAHDSVGSQPTCSNMVDYVKMAESCGYDKAWSVSSEFELRNILPQLISFDGTCLLEIKVKCGARSDLGRPKEKPIENKDAFMNFLREK
jgi:phosphonopyruvate decarboxylase